ncbi:hypothetical protein ACVIIV_003444 [Bradyrhizobium sp. USDA 4354]
MKDYLTVYYTSGPDWTDRMKRLAARAPDLNIFGQGLVAREPGQWIITEKGRAFLALLEQMRAPTAQDLAPEGRSEKPFASNLAVLAAARQGHSASPGHRRRKRLRTRDGRSS